MIQGIAQPPQTAIVYPANDAVFTAGSDVFITADASEPDGTITNVEFYIDNTLPGQDNIPPYTSAWNPVHIGTYLLLAKAYHDTGLATISEGVMVTIGPPPPVLSVSPSNHDVTAASGITVFEGISNTGRTATCQCKSVDSVAKGTQM